jgi:hypothetical protein
LSNEPEEASSPWGQFLIRKKMNTQHKHKNEAKTFLSLINAQKTE